VYTRPAPAEKPADKVLKRRIDAAGVSVQPVAVKAIIDGNKADAIQRENHFKTKVQAKFFFGGGG